jgi:hypothetical protein
VPLIRVIFMTNKFLNGTNIIVKQDIIFLIEEILEFFMAPVVKPQLSVLAQKIPALSPGVKGVGDREILETLEFSFKKYTRYRHFSSWDKIFVDQCNYSLRMLQSV